MGQQHLSLEPPGQALCWQPPSRHLLEPHRPPLLGARGTQQSGSVPDDVPLPSQKHVVETFFGFDEESVDSETLSETSCNTDRTDRAPATPEEDLDDVSGPRPEMHVEALLASDGGESCSPT